MLTVYKASAGSGKTFRLVTEYIKLILTNEQQYKAILGVTFTNKATAEMKGRILAALSLIATGDGSGTIPKLIASETGLNPEDIKARAGRVLKNILYDYSRFSISTIDKFTQRVIKAFNREIGIAPGYTLELDNELVLQEATDRLILKSGEDKKLLKWLKKLGQERINDSKGFDIKREIFTLGKELFNEQFQDYFTGDQKLFYSQGHLKKYRKSLRRILENFEAQMKGYGENGLAIIAQNGFSITDFAFGETGIASVFSKAANKKYEFGTRILNDSADPEKWANKKHPRRDLIISLAESQLLPLLKQIIDFYELYKTSYYSAREVGSSLYTLGLLNYLHGEIGELRKEKGILPIADSNFLLKKIIGGSDAPFIFEKTGTRYSHFMLDEFQDTSAMQWENFKPLIDNSLAEGKGNLIVGDAKQSIYRWRNGDWKILATGIENQFAKHEISILNLQSNWRSYTNIIGFNNLAFPSMARKLSAHFRDNTEHDSVELSGLEGLIERIYHDVAQTAAKAGAKHGGYVEASFISETDKKSFEELSLTRLLQQVKQLRDAGFAGSEIAILIRRNQEGTEIIRYFIEAAQQPENSGYNLEIISNESLFLSSSHSVAFVVNMIYYLIEPDDKINKAALLNEYKYFLAPVLLEMGNETVLKPDGSQDQTGLKPGFPDEFEEWLLPAISQLKTAVLNASIDEVITLICHTFKLFSIEGDVPFLLGLIDNAAQVKSGLSNDLSNFIQWWEEKGIKLSVNVSDDSDSIRLLTVHKSKGLEFRAVLIPFFDWELKWKNHIPLLWCRPDTTPFADIPLVPVRATEKLKQTIFSEDYYCELLDTYIDNLNLIYVAFTRAVEALFVNAPAKTSDKISAVGDLLYAAVAESEGLQWDSSHESFTFGEPVFARVIPQESSNPVQISRYTFNKFDSRLKLHANAESFFPDLVLPDKNLGTLVHEILSAITVAGDVEKACRKALVLQKIKQSEYDSLVRWFAELVSEGKPAEWFSGKYKVLNERNILSPEGIRRPDRVMVGAGSAIVVDYKLGEPVPGKYNRQVASYMSELEKCGFASVEGYIWYLVSNSVEKVAIR